MLSATETRFITTFQVVPSGTNGGITPAGLLASLSGGKLIGLCMALCLYLEGWQRINIWRMISLGGIAGLMGSLVGHCCPLLRLARRALETNYVYALHSLIHCWELPCKQRTRIQCRKRSFNSGRTMLLAKKSTEEMCLLTTR